MSKRKSSFTFFITNILVISLIQTQLTTFAYAFDANDASAVIGTIGNLGQNILAQKQQIQQQQMAAIMAQKIQQQLRPQLGPSKYFPECQLPSAMQPVPLNVCKASNDVSKLSSLYAYEAAAQDLMNYFDQMTNMAHKVDRVGLLCLDSKKKALDSEITEMINNLTRLQDKLKEEAQQFRENNKAIISDLEDTNSELMGTNDSGSAKNAINTKSRDFSKLVSQDCQKAIGPEFSRAKEVGFNGLLQNMSPKNLAANDFQRSKTQIEAEIRNQVQKIRDNIATNGIDYFNAPDGRGKLDNVEKLSSYPALKMIVDKEQIKFTSQAEKISNQLKKLGYTGLPSSLEKDTSKDLGSSISSVQSTLKSEYVKDCTLKADKGVAIEFSKLLDSIEKKNTDSSNVPISGYREALKNIIESDDSLDTKLLKIKELEGTYSGMTITYKNFKSESVTETPYEILMKTKSNCENKFEQNKSGDSKTVQNLLQEYKNLTDSYPNRIGSNIVDTLINCNGEGLKATDKCNEETLDPSKSGNFCLSKASSCANNMLSCYNEVNQSIEKRKTKMNNLAKTFNKNVESMVNRANALYKSQAANINTLTKMLQARFPGSNFEIPADMFISLPETSKDKYGIDLAMNGDINKITAELPTKIDKLKEIFAKQKETAMNEINEYIERQTSNIKDQREKFKTLYDQCKSAADATSKAIAEANAAGMKAQQEQDQKLGEFCQKYSNLSENPAAGCGDASGLYEDSMKISAHLDPRMGKMLNHYRGVCNSYNNEGENGNEAIEEACYKKYPSNDTMLNRCIERQTKKNSKNAPLKKAKKLVSIDIDRICSKETSDDDFISAIEKKLKLDLSEKDVEKIKSARKKYDTEKLENENLAFFKEMLEDTQIFKKDKAEKPICEQLLDSKKELAKSSEEYKKQEEKIKELEKKKTDEKATDTAEIISEKKKLENMEDSKEINNRLSSIANDLLDDGETPEESAISSLGEQMTSVPCGANANTMMPKNQNAFDFNTYHMQQMQGMGR